MKKILIIDGGPRKKFNLAQLLKSFTEGVKSVDASIEVEHDSKYDLAAFSPEAKKAWRDAHWEEDRQKAFQAGVNMANKILAK